MLQFLFFLVSISGSTLYPYLTSCTLLCDQSQKGSDDYNNKSKNITNWVCTAENQKHNGAKKNSKII